MKRINLILLLLSVLLVLCACSQPATAVSTIEPIAESPEPLPFIDDTIAINEAAASVVKLNCYNKSGELVATGSGFAAFEDGIIVTNYHVIEDRVYNVTAELENGMFFNVDWVIAFDKAKDVVLLGANTKIGLALLPIGDSETVVKGERILAIGYPLGLGNTISTGVISSLYEDDSERIIQFTAPISHGSSGGALFNEKGEVIGVTYASFVDGQNLNLAVPIEEAVNLWNSRDTMDKLSFKDFSSSGAISISELAASPEKYEGQKITIEGYIDSITKDAVILVDSEEDRALTMIDTTIFYTSEGNTNGWRVVSSKEFNMIKKLNNHTAVAIEIDASNFGIGFDNQYVFSGVFTQRNDSGGIGYLELRNAMLIN